MRCSNYPLKQSTQKQKRSCYMKWCLVYRAMRLFLGRAFKRTIRKCFIFFSIFYVINLTWSFLRCFYLQRLVDDELSDAELVLPGPDDLCSALPYREHPLLEQNEIFFLETSGEPCLTARQACSIESAIRTNPDAKIVIRMEGMGVLDDPGYRAWKSKHENLPGHKRSCTITERVLGLREHSVQLIREDLMAHLNGTPLHKLALRLKESHSNSSINQFPLHQRSDLVRVALMWKQGGLYLDLDVVVLRPLYCLQNTLGLGNDRAMGENWVENGVMTFQPQHPFLLYLMHYMVEEFELDAYMSLGPPTVSSALLDFCEIDKLPNSQVGGVVVCFNASVINLEPRSSFYALDNKDRNVFFEHVYYSADVEALHRSYVSHIYNAGHGNFAPPGSLYSSLARRYCPVTYRMAMEELGEF